MIKIAHGLALLVMISGAASADFSDCLNHYSKGKQLMEDGEYAQASAEFKQAISLDPEPKSGTTIYLPYMNLAISAYKAERYHLARESLVQSQVYGVVRATPEGSKLLENYASVIMESPLNRPDEPLPSAYSSVFRELEKSNISL